MPTSRRSRTIAAPEEELWDVIRDPHHLPRWWPRVTRVEDVEDGAFTEVMKTRKGKLVRADFTVAVCDEAGRTLIWSQLIEGTPFARVLQSAETQVGSSPPGDRVAVTRRRGGWRAAARGDGREHRAASGDGGLLPQLRPVHGLLRALRQPDGAPRRAGDARRGT